MIEIEPAWETYDRKREWELQDWYRENEKQMIERDYGVKTNEKKKMRNKR